VVVVLPSGLVTDPETLPARVAANGRTTVPLVLENRAALPPGRYPAYALFEYTVSGEHHAAVAAPTSRWSRTRAVGARARCWSG